MKTVPMFLLLLFVALVAGCSEQAPRTVTDGVDQQAIRDYEAELAKITKQDAESNMGTKVKTEEKEEATKKEATK